MSNKRNDLTGLLMGTKLARTVTGQVVFDLVGLVLLVVIVVVLLERPLFEYGLPAAYILYAAVRAVLVARRNQRP